MLSKQLLICSKSKQNKIKVRYLKNNFRSFCFLRRQIINKKKLFHNAITKEFIAYKKRQVNLHTRHVLCEFKRTCLTQLSPLIKNIIFFFFLFLQNIIFLQKEMLTMNLTCYNKLFFFFLKIFNIFIFVTNFNFHFEN